MWQLRHSSQYQKNTVCYAATENTKSQQNDGATISSVTFIRNEPEIKNKIHTHIRIGAD